MIARLAVLGLALAAGLGGTALAGRLPLGPAGAALAAPAAAPVRLAIAAATPALVCPGPETAVTPDGGTPLAAPGPYSVTAAAVGDGRGRSRLGRLGAGTAWPLEGDAALRVLTRPGNPRGPLRLAADGATTPAGTDRSALLAATQVTIARRGDLRGLSSAACGPAASDVWLVGGATTPGHRLRLLLTNPTPAAAVVDVHLAGPTGRVAVPSARGLVVAPGAVRAVQLDALAPGLEEPVVRVVARSGRVAAVLHHSWLRGAAPGGVDDVVPAAAPARSLVVTGVFVPRRGWARLRVAAATGADAVVRFRVIGPTGEVTPRGTGVVTVPGGGSAAVGLTGLPAGPFTLVLTSDEPVVAGALLAVNGPRLGALRTVAGDFAWTAATPPLRGTVLAAAPRPVDSRNGVVTPAPTTAQLVLGGSDGPAQVRVREADAAGRPVRTSTLDVPVNRTVAVTLTPATVAYALEVPRGRSVHAALVVSADDPAGSLLTALPLWPAVVAAPVAPPVQADPTLGSR